MPSQATRALRRRRRGVLSPLPLPRAPTPCAPVRRRRARWRTHLHHNHRDHRGIGARVRAGSPTMTGQCEKSTHGRSEINREIRYETTWDTTSARCNIVIQRRPKPWTDQAPHLTQSSEQQGGHGVTSALDDLAIKCRLPLLQLPRIGVTIERNSIVERVARDVGDVKRRCRPKRSGIAAASVREPEG